MEIKIRKYELKDRAQLRQIVHDTALMGEPADLFFHGQEVLCDAFSRYFTDFEPESCFVAENGIELVGYLIGAKNKARSEAVFTRRILLPLLFKAMRTGVFLHWQNIRFIFLCLKDLLVNGIRTPDFNRRYPATMHLNVKKVFRGQKTGSRLCAAFLEYLKKEKTSGVHLATMSEEAAEFFTTQGFVQLYKGKRSYFRNILGRDVPLYIFGQLL